MGCLVGSRARTRENFPRMKVRGRPRRDRAESRAFFAALPPTPWVVMGRRPTFAELLNAMILGQQAEVWKVPDDPLDGSSWAALDSEKGKHHW